MTLSAHAIDHIQIAIAPEHEDACIAFYRDLLGLQQIEKPAALRGRGGAWFQIGQLQLHIGIDPGAIAGARAHICFLIDDLERARDVFGARGFEITEDSAQVDGLTRFFVKDPAGNRVEIGARD